MEFWAWFGPAEAALCVAGGWWLWRHWGSATPAKAPLRARRSAMLLNADGVLDSVRTLHGDPPTYLTTARRRYRLDRAASTTHWVYRAES